MKEFHKTRDPIYNRERSKTYYHANKVMCREKSRHYYRRNKPAILKYLKKYTLQKLFGLTVQQFEDMLEAQDGKCAICGNPPKKNQLNVDHDHETNVVRGLLCISCNRVLGFMDQPEWLAKALEYQKRGQRDHFMYEHREPKGYGQGV